jgi:GNAT superfamily N-acetyltransferase
LEGLKSPRLLRPDDNLLGFDCGVFELNDWLIRRALNNHNSGASKTCVVDHGGVVVAFYCLAAGSLEHANAPGNMRRNMPEPLPIVVMGRLAIDVKIQGKGIGSVLVLDAIERTAVLSAQIGIRAIMVHAKDEASAAFYRHVGFVPSPISPLTLMLRV